MNLNEFNLMQKKKKYVNSGNNLIALQYRDVTIKYYVIYT